MSQQINLYSPAFRTREAPFSAKAMAQSAVLVAVALTAFGLYARMQVRAVEEHAATTSDRLRLTITQLGAAGKDTAREDRIKALEAQIRESEAKLAGRKQIMATLDQLASTRQRAYSEYLRALARRSLDGVWLTSVTANAEQEVLSITGRALRAELIPTYIDGLRREESFKGLGFDRLVINTVKAPAPEGVNGKADMPREFVEFQLQSLGFEETAGGRKP